jgi:hypothetical protein|tara:strand:- start:154 stop:324 length:171 start_codon:yes stop_codon:yes gene_type:complete
MKVKAKTKEAKRLFNGKDFIVLENNSYSPINEILLWCSETKNDFKSNFEIVRKDNK